LLKEFKTNEATINTELIKHKVKAQEMVVYYNPALTSVAMRPSATFNAILAKIA
jgi:isocitrate dehydrogenase